MSALRKFLRSDIGWIVVVGIALLVAQITATLVTAFEIERTNRRIAADLAKLDAAPLVDEKTRQEVLDRRVQNEMRSFVSNSLLIGIGPSITAFVALVGALLGLRNYLQSREKERLDRASAELTETMNRLVEEKPWQRAAGIVGLQHFLAPDLNGYHLRAVSALAMAARMDDVDPNLREAIRIAVEQAVKSVDEPVMQQVSWQWTRLANAQFAGRSLRRLDFRNAVLRDADFSACDLSGCRFNNAQLNGAKLDGCNLSGADLTYADLAGASLVNANLAGAKLAHAKVQNLDVGGADLQGAELEEAALPWQLIVNWRKAKLRPDLRSRLVERFGGDPSGPRVLMLMWEIPPFVAGGTWTACYHLVRNLRRRGANVTVVVPWDERLIEANPFGSEVRVVPLGITPPELEPGQGVVYSAYPGPGPSWSPYAGMRSWSAYGGTQSWSAYGGAWPSWSPYASSSPYGARGPGAYGKGSGPSLLLRLIGECRERILEHARNGAFDVIHAHDWVTFDAAAAASRASGKPWIAHFHSIEQDRRPEQPDFAVERIEREAAASAAAILAPSRFSAGRIATQYALAPGRVTVAPNTLSREPIPPPEQLGLYDTRRVLFLGRLTAQKGPDLFARIAQATRARAGEGVAKFEVRGSGEQVAELRAANLYPSGPIEWAERGRAFGDVSAVVVPSRAEPFGMVILEAMQHRVPVLYPQNAGAAEVLTAGVRIDPNDAAASAEALAGLLQDRGRWEALVLAQTQEISGYPERGYERSVQDLYAKLAQAR